MVYKDLTARRQTDRTNSETRGSRRESGQRTRKDIDKMLLLGVRTYRVEGEGSTVTKPRFYFPKSKQKRSVTKRSGNEEGEVWKEKREWSVTKAFLRDSH